MQAKCAHSFKRVAIHDRKTGELIGHECVDCGDRKEPISTQQEVNPQ